MFPPYVNEGIFPSEMTEENAIFTYISIQSANITKILENVTQNGREKILLKIKNGLQRVGSKCSKTIL